MSGSGGKKNQRIRRRSLRLPNYDYSSAGAYYVTLCTRGRACIFGEVFEDLMHLSDIGHIVVETWEWLSTQYPYVTLDEYILMPNHLHGIIVIHERGMGGSRTAPTEALIIPKPLGGLIGAFKTVSTKRVNQHLGCPGKILWQRNYYEHIIRSYKELGRIRRYIANNALRWELDRENPIRRSEHGM